MPDFLSNIEKARQSIFTSDARRSLIFIGLAFLVLFLYLTKNKTRITINIIKHFILADFPVLIVGRYLNDKNFVSKAHTMRHPKTLADEQYCKIKA